MKRLIKDITKLKTPAEPVKFITETGIDKTECEEIIAAVKEYMEAHKTLLALSAPQIGINKRVFCIRFADTIKTFINPILKKKSKDPIITIETLPNIPDTEIAICRPSEVEIAYYTDDFKYEDNKLLGPAAALFEQQIQLLDGIVPGEVISILDQDYVIKPEDILSIICAEYSGGGLLVQIESEEDHITENDLQQLATILAHYKETFKVIGDSFATSTDEAIKETYAQLKFTEKVITGQAAIVAKEPKQNRAQRRAIKFNKNNMLKKGLK